MQTHRVKQGDSLASLEETYGIPWQKIWYDDSNTDLRSKRKDPNILLPGDQVHIPDKEKREETCSSGSKHSFKLSCPRPILKICLRVRMVDGEEVILNHEDYEIQFDVGQPKTGTTDGEGYIQESIPPRAKKASIAVHSQNLTLPINLGHLDPIDHILGIQSRLNMLGYESGATDDNLGPLTEEAVKRFQKDKDLRVDGVPGPQTQNKLKEVFGS